MDDSITYLICIYKPLFRQTCRWASLYLEEEIPSEQVEKASKEKERSE
jgi:hypothetical protein